jgi:SNF2 family DNA or RNA helicase
LVGLPTEQSTPSPRVRLGADIRFWAVAARFTLELLARQRFVPAVVAPEDGKQARSLWKPYLEDEQERLARLSAMMPPACRAALGPDGEPAAAETVLSEFITALADGFVRQAAGRLRIRPRFHGTAGDHYVASLLSPDAGLAVPVEEITELRESLGAWSAALEEETETAFRIAFRLEPPELETEGAEARWTLRYFLQATDDPSLLVPVSAVWQHSGRVWAYLNRRLSRPQERVLEGLGRASTLFPPIEESLKEARPEACRFGVEEAHRFLREAALLLEESGYGVLVPSWWGKLDHGLGLKLHLNTPRDPGAVAGSNRLGMDALIQFDWQVALGGDTLDRQEFLALAALKQPLVRVRGRWVELRPEQIEKAMEALAGHVGERTMSLRDALQLGLGGVDGGRLPVVGLSAEGWLDDLLTHLSGAQPMPRVGPPPGFQGELRPYQLTGLSWLSFLGRWGLGACLADDMGLGKTIQVLALLLHRKARGELEAPVLLLCPTSVVSNWRKEAERFAPSLRVLIHHGVDRHGDEAFGRAAERHDLVVSTYSLVHRDLERLSRVKWSALVLDEAQNIKNPAAKQTQALRGIAAPTRIALTGTPVENRLSELWSIMEFLNPGYLGGLTFFKRRFGLPIERYRDPTATEELRRLVQPFLLRRLKTDPKVIRDLPDKNEMKVYCSLTREQATLYEAVVREGLRRIEQAEGIGRRGEVLATLTRLKQVCNHPTLYLGDGSRLGGRSGKLDRLTEMLEEVVSGGDRALVFTQFATMGGHLRRHLREVLETDVLFLHGGVPASQREKMIARFQDERGGPPLFVLSLKAGGFGLNLTRACHVFHFDRWWNPAVENQATDRAFRIGQTRLVAVHKFVCAGTLEERIDELIERKKELAQQVVGAGEAWITELSTDELRQLFALRAEAVQD